MKINILWSGREYYSLENCLINMKDTGSDITSTVVGYYNKLIYQVTYHIQTNNNWQTILFEIDFRCDDKIDHIKYEGDGKGNWYSNGKHLTGFKDCIDVDIPLTPFTNTLPINRLRLRQNDESRIQVIYVDLFERQTKPVQQKYRRVSDTMYHYENVPNDFEADVVVDEFGFVVDYPRLFVRTARNVNV